MRRGTTPLHTFQLPFEIPSDAKVRLVYSQNRRIILERTTDTIAIDGDTVSVKLTVEETLLFDSAHHNSTGPDGTYPIEIQVGIRTEEGDQFWSDIIEDSVYRILREDGVI